MPVRRRRDKRRGELEPAQEAWLRGDDRGAGFVNYLPDDRLKELWLRFGESVIEDHAAQCPGTRPGKWWRFSAPEMRKRTGGVGTPVHEVLEHFQDYRYGIPKYWVLKFHEEFYSESRKEYGRLAVPKELPFRGVAINPNDPPTFESQSAYLKRLGLLLPGEATRLRKADFEDEAVGV